MPPDEKTIESAATIAAKVAHEAALVAHKVAERAADVAERVAEAGTKMSSAILLLSQDMVYIKSDLKDIKDKLDSKYVTVEAFIIVRNVVFGMVGLILVTVLTAVLIKVIE